MATDMPPDTSSTEHHPADVAPRGGIVLRSVAFVRSSWRALLLPLGTVVMTILLVALVPVDVMERLGNYGYLGVFVLTLLASASIVLPSPALATAWLAGKTLDPWLVGILSGVAAGIGEITGYLAGYSGSTLAVRSRWYPRVEAWVRRWGPLTVFVLAAVPSPLIDLAGIAAGTLRLRFSLYLVACILGKTLRFIGVAWLGRLT
jgi:membrane protein YqaA with SNARE-associated domain